MKNYIEINRELWNKRTPVHLRSEFYGLDNFIGGKSSLNAIELELLGDVSRKTILHLQCHFGQDSISLSRMGAKVTGVDLSDKAIDAARELAQRTHADAEFICCDIYDLPSHCDRQFDLVFTSYGTIGWLPDLNRWAAIVSRFLKPGGRFVFAEFHPFIWMFDNDLQTIAYSYFNGDAIVETESGTYADTGSAIDSQSVNWNHGLGEVVGSLRRQGLTIEALQEYDHSPYNCFPGMVEPEPGKFRIGRFGNKIPLVYSILAFRPHGA